MAVTYEPIASQTLGADAATVTFSSLPSSYTDLRCIIVGRKGTTTGNAYPLFQVNSDTGSNYSVTWVYGFNSAAYSARESSQTGVRINPSNMPQSNEDQATFILDLMSYANTNVNKTVLFTMSMPVFNTTNWVVGRGVGLWRSTSAITSIDIKTSADSWDAGSTFSLFGVKAQ